MDILKKLSFENLKLNKKRTISTIIGIILSCALICATATLVTSFRETLIQYEANSRGYYHLEISGAEDSDIKDFKNNRDIKDVLNIYENGYGKFEQGENEYFPYLKINSMSKTMFKYLKFKISEGRFPENENELIISKNAISYGDEDLKVGDKITIDVGKRMSEDGEILWSSNPHQENETLIDTVKREFTIVGTINRPDLYFENYDDPGFTAITTNSDFGRNRTYIVLKNPRDYKNSIAKILGAPNFDKIDTDPNLELRFNDYKINDGLLRWEALAFGDETTRLLMFSAIIVISIIMVTSVFCIKNSISISVTEKIKMYGMLSSVGATGKQIKKNVIFEALILGLVGIPLGIIGGIFGVFVLIKVVNLIGGDLFLANVSGITVKVSIYPIIIAVVLSFVTLYLSAIFPARRASKTSPLDLIRSPEKVKFKARKLKVPIIISKIFKVGGELAYKNLKRSKKKYRTTVISITVSIMIFIIMNSFIGNVFDLSGEYYNDYEYNVDFWSAEDLSNSEIEKIKKMENTNSYIELYNRVGTFACVYNLDQIDEYYEKHYLSRGEFLDYDEASGTITASSNEVNPDERLKTDLFIIGYNSKDFNRFLEKIKVNPKTMKRKAILYDNYNEYQDNKITKRRIYSVSKGDTLETVFTNNGTEDEKIEKYEIGAITDVRPFGEEQNYSDGGYLVLNIDDFPEYEFKIDNLLVQADDPEAFDDEFEKLNIDLGLYGYRNIGTMVKEQETIIFIMKIFLYGFIAVITLIGVTNIFNTITSNMELRQKEFASLKSIGMTKREFNRMINLETIFYSVKSLFYGIILGLAGTFLLYKAFSIKLDTGKVYIPYSAIIISIIAVFVLIFVIMRYSIRKINKQNIIETIRKENI